MGALRIPARFPRLTPESGLWLALFIIVGLLTVLPLLKLVEAAIMPGGTFDLGRILAKLTHARTLAATFNTIWISLSATAIATVIGTLAAVLVSLTDLRTRTIWVFAFVLPLMIPPQVTALAWIQAFAPSSPLLGPLGLSLEPGTRHPLYSAGGMIFLLGLYNAPLVFLSVKASLQRVPAHLVEAARANGASAPRAVRDVVLPLIRSGIFAGASLAFVSAIGNFGIQAMLGIPARIPTLITQIYREMSAYGATALGDTAILALFLAVITLAGMVIAAWLGGRRDQTVELSRRPPRFALGRWQGVALLVAWLYILVCLIVPLSGLAGAALVRGYGQPLTSESLTLANFTTALFNHQGLRGAFLTSLWLTLLSVAILVPLAVALGYVLSWRKGLAMRILQMSSELAYALPGVVMGIAMILLFLQPLPFIGTGLYGTVWVILFAYLANFLALALRPILSGFAQIERSLDEAAQLTGANIFARLRDIVLPNLAPATAASAILLMMTAINEIQTSVLLVSSRAQTIGPMIIFLEEAGSSTLAAAVGCLMIAFITMLMALSLLLDRYLPKGALPWHD